ncbi:MAG: SRPBCC family protein [Bdellovibrio sp.]|nr:SRPBCC family protein [Bdellovibrio sp.]
MVQTFRCQHISVSIQKTPAEVYAFASQPDNMPKWAAGLSRSTMKKSGEVWIADSPMGSVTVKFAPHNSFGVLDHDVTLSNGALFHNPLRILKNGGGSEVVFTLYRHLDMTDEAFANDAKQVHADLIKLKSLLEN